MPAITIYSLYALLALLGPYLIFKIFNGSERVIEQCDATITCISLNGRPGVTNSYDLYKVSLPNGREMLLDVSKERARNLTDIIVKARVTVSRSLLGKPFISAVRWPGETVDSAGDIKITGALLSGAYLMVAILAAGYTCQASVYDNLGHIGVFYACLLIVISGYVMGKFHTTPMTGDVQSSMLFGLVKFGSGKQSLVAMASVALIITLGCFWFGGVAIFLGLNTGFSAGMLFALALKLTR